MNNKFVLKHDSLGANAGTPVNITDAGDIQLMHPDGKVFFEISKSRLEKTGQSYEDWLEPSTRPKVDWSDSLVIQFTEHCIEIERSNGKVKPVYELQKFFKKF